MVRHIWTCHQLVECGSLHPHGVHSRTHQYYQFTVTLVHWNAFTCTIVLYGCKFCRNYKLQPMHPLLCLQCNSLPLNRMLVQCTTLHYNALPRHCSWLLGLGGASINSCMGQEAAVGKAKELLVFPKLFHFLVELPSGKCPCALFSYTITLSIVLHPSIVAWCRQPQALARQRMGTFSFQKLGPFSDFFSTNTFR